MDNLAYCLVGALSQTNDYINYNAYLKQIQLWHNQQHVNLRDKC